MTSSTFPNETGSRAVEDLARRHPGVVTVARLGWIAKGVVYGILGILAVSIALDGTGSERSGSGEASQVGAVAEVAQSPLGEAALYVLAVGLLLYAAWRVVSVVLPAENSPKAWVTRLGYSVSAVVYVALAWSALSFARHQRGASTTSEDAKVERLARDLMEMSYGRWLVGVIGAVVIGIGCYFAVKGALAKFRDELEPGDVGPVSKESIVLLGRVGWVGRGIVMGLVGCLLIRAAVRFRPDDAKGFDGALREVTGSSLGAVLVGFAAVALVLYGLFCVLSAPRQRLSGAD
jgi:Domain of Unknown Function (DUF1206)